MSGKGDQSKLNIEQWLLDAARMAKDAGGSSTSGGLTSNELRGKAKEAGIPIGRGRLMRLLREAKDAGKIEVAFEERTSLTGASYSAPVYILVSDDEDEDEGTS